MCRLSFIVYRISLFRLSFVVSHLSFIICRLAFILSAVCKPCCSCFSLRLFLLWLRFLLFRSSVCNHFVHFFQWRAVKSDHRQQCRITFLLVIWKKFRASVCNLSYRWYFSLFATAVWQSAHRHPTFSNGGLKKVQFVCLQPSFIVYRYRLSFISVVIYRLSLIDYRLLFIAYYHYPLSFITIIVIVYRVSFVVYRFTQTHTCAHEHTRWSFGGREAGGREGPAESFDRNRGSKCENIDVSWDIRSKSRFQVWKCWF